MRTPILNLLVLLPFFLLAPQSTAIAQKNTVEKVPATCKGLPREQRPRITVTSFDITRSSAQGVVGNAVKNQDAAAASRIGSRFGADIVIFGEAFSENTGLQNGLQTCRARVEARAVSTRNAQILAADGKHAGGLDNSELVAGKAALRKAGALMGAYFVNTLCEATGIVKGGGGNDGNTSEIVLNNASFFNASKIETFIKGLKGVKNVTRTFSNGVARFVVVHTGALDPIASALDQGRAGVPVEITGADGSKLEGRVK